MSDKPDANCITLPDGSCVGVGCMHDASPGAAGMTTPRTPAGRALLEELRAKAPSDLSEEDYFTREAMRWTREAVERALPAIEAEAQAAPDALLREALDEWLKSRRLSLHSEPIAGHCTDCDLEIALTPATPPASVTDGRSRRAGQAARERFNAKFAATPPASAERDWPSPDDEAAVEALARVIHEDVTDPPFSMDGGAMCECAREARRVLSNLRAAEAR